MKQLNLSIQECVNNNLETLLTAKDKGRCVLIKRRSKGAAIPSWALAKVISVDPDNGSIKVVEFKKLKINSIEAVKFPGQQSEAEV